MLTIYSKDDCPQCRTALAMVKAKGQEHEVLKLGVDFTKEELLALAPTARTFPQIAKDGNVIGGISDLQKYLLTV